MTGRHPAPSGATTFLTAARRETDIEQAADRGVDVLVVGGGVTGTGAALDAATRGLSVALVERGDLAMGTSRFSSKLAHGGLRYLARLGFGIAWESARERATLIDTTAPHMVRALPQLTPIFARSAPALAVPLAGVRTGDAMRALAGTSRHRLPAARRVSAEEARLWAPTVNADALRAAILSWDAALEDDARLVIALARTAAAYGAHICTYCQVTALTGDGARVRDTRTGERFEVRAHHTVNAAGIWAGALVEGVQLQPSKGAHVLVDGGRLGRPRAMINVPLAGHLGRFVFAVPRDDGLVMLGVTDDPLAPEESPDALAVTLDEQRFLLEALSSALQPALTDEDVVGRFAGVRPLLGAGTGRTADISRRHAVLEDPATGAITVVGGKLTTYRRMAEDALDVIAARPGVRAAPCQTRSLPLVGAPAGATRAPAGIPRRLWRRFGTEAGEIIALADDRPMLLEPLADGVPALGVEALAALEREGALTVDDVLDGRMRLDLVPAWREAARPVVERLLAALVGT